MRQSDKRLHLVGSESCEKARDAKSEAEKQAHFELLLACFRSEQMSISQLRAHMADDPEFERFISQRMGL